MGSYNKARLRGKASGHGGGSSNQDSRKRNQRSGSQYHIEKRTLRQPLHKGRLLAGLLYFIAFAIITLCSIYSVIEPVKMLANAVRRRQPDMVGSSVDEYEEVHSPKTDFVPAKENDVKQRKSTVDNISKFQKQTHFSLRPRSVTIDNRAITFKELKHNVKDSHVRVFVADNFLSEQECNALSAVHSKHVQEHNKMSPLICFDSQHTLMKNIEEIGLRLDFNKIQFLKGTQCLNESMSKALQKKMLWSFSTAFYPGESKFSYSFESRVQDATNLKSTQGGKFQITSYPQQVGYKNHTDCTIGGDKRDRFATVLVYLQDVKEGGETIFPKLGISVKPKQGRLLVWNSMTPDGQCDIMSLHNAAKVVKGRKYILQRWYYYENFFSLGKRPPEPDLPQRRPLQPRVSCDEYEYGSCRWYDEWGYDHIIEYNKLKSFLP